MSREAKFFIGVDTYDKDSPAYCLASITPEGYTHIILCKTIKQNINEFDEEVKNLSKYFNAKVIEESHTIKKHIDEGDGTFKHLMKTLSFNINKPVEEIPKFTG